MTIFMGMNQGQLWSSDPKSRHDFTILLCLFEQQILMMIDKVDCIFSYQVITESLLMSFKYIYLYTMCPLLENCLLKDTVQMSTFLNLIFYFLKNRKI